MNFRRKAYRECPKCKGLGAYPRCAMCDNTGRIPLDDEPGIVKAILALLGLISFVAAIAAITTLL